MSPTRVNHQRHNAVRMSLKLSAATALLCLLGACGFQLSKPISVGDEYQPVFVDDRSTLDRELLRALQSRQYATTRLGSAKSRLSFEKVDLEERDFSITSTGRNAEYLLILSAELRWVTTGQSPEDETGIREILLLNETLRAETTFASNPFNPSAEAAERKLMQRRLEKRLVQDALDRLSFASQRLSAGDDALEATEIARH